MRRSAQVAAPLLAAAALALTTGCRKPEMQRCVDENNHVVNDKLCASQPQAERRPDGHGGFLFVPMPYRYYYGGYGGYAPGTVVGGGGYTPPAGPQLRHKHQPGRVRQHAGRGKRRTQRWRRRRGRIMRRHPLTPRPDWQRKVEAVGLAFHTLDDGTPYWDESAAYEFTAAEIDTLEAAGNTLQQMCLAAAQHVIDERRYAELGIPASAIPAIEWAWDNEPPALYGRFDLMWNGNGSPKLLEYNADTPTSLLEAAVVQWDWLEKLLPSLTTASHLGKPDQFNSIHDKLIAKWKDVTPYLKQPVYFAGVDSPEDQLTLAYLRDTAQQADLTTLQMYMEEIGWNDERQAFLDPNEDPMLAVFKLYPWEVMLAEEFGQHALDTYQQMRWIEPIWKLLLSNKGILPILWQLYPNHELLLPAFLDEAPVHPGAWQPVVLPGTQPPPPLAPHGLRDYIRKPLFSREGANITVVRNGTPVVSTGGPYTGCGIVQALAPEAIFQGRHPVLGLWMVDQECCGLGIRESLGHITDNRSSFVPHYFR